MPDFGNKTLFLTKFSPEVRNIFIILRHIRSRIYQKMILCQLLKNKHFQSEIIKVYDIRSWV